MIINFLKILVFVFIAVVFMVLGLYFSRYKQRHKKSNIERSKKITVSCSACPKSVSKTCKEHL